MLFKYIINIIINYQFFQVLLYIKYLKLYKYITNRKFKLIRITMWSDNKCMSSITKNDITRRCQRTSKESSDFCGYHQRNKKYYPALLKTVKKHDIQICGINENIKMKSLNLEIKNFINSIIINDIIQKIKNALIVRNKLLDQKYDYCLMDIYSSWSEVPLYYQIQVDDHWWHLELIIYHITNQLNQSNMENPYPVYPSDPFTRKPFSCKSILKIKDRIKLLNIDINIALNVLLNIDFSTMQHCYIQSIENSNRFSRSLDLELKRYLRYKLINSKNSQNNFIGHWVSINEDKSTFENYYDAWRNTPYQIINPTTYEIIPNFRKQDLYNKLTKLHIEQWGPIDDSAKIKLKLL